MEFNLYFINKIIAFEIRESFFRGAVVASVCSGCGVPTRVAGLGIIRRARCDRRMFPYDRIAAGRMITYSPNLITAE